MDTIIKSIKLMELNTSIATVFFNTLFLKGIYPYEYMDIIYGNSIT